MNPVSFEKVDPNVSLEISETCLIISLITFAILDVFEPAFWPFEDYM